MRTMKTVVSIFLFFELIHGMIDLIGHDMASDLFKDCTMIEDIDRIDRWDIKVSESLIKACPKCNYKIFEGLKAIVTCENYDPNVDVASQTSKCKGAYLKISDGAENQCHYLCINNSNTMVTGTFKRVFRENIEVQLIQGFSLLMDELSTACTVSSFYSHEDRNIKAPQNRIANDDDCGRMKVPLGKIIGGKEAFPHNYPWMVLLNVGGIRLCGASILNRYYLLTAAHCIQGARWVVVYLGLHRLARLKMARFAKQIHVHPDFSFPNSDIALIRVTTAMIYDGNVGPVCLPTRKLAVGESVLAAGWGKTSDGGSEASTVLKENSFTVISDLSCSNAYGGATLHPSVVCTKDRAGQSICQGDSGSGIGIIYRQRFYQQGVVSFTASSCEQGHPVGYTEVFDHLDWIRNTVE